MSKKLTYFYLIPLWAVLLAGCVFSLLKTTYFELYVYNEIPKYKSDHPLLLLVLLAVFLLLAYKGSRLLDRQSLSAKRLSYIACGWAFLLSLFFVLLFRCGVVCDSGFLSDYAVQFMQGDYSALTEGEYLHHYPFQLGMIALLELLYRAFGVENYLAFQLLNVIAIVSIILSLNRITEELFEEEKVRKLEAVISLGMLPLYLFATFVYGDIIGVALGIWAIYCGIRYIKEEKVRYLLVSGLLFMVAVVVKSNIYVLMVAFVIAMLIKMFQNKRWWLILLLFGIILGSQAGIKGVETMYAKRAGIEQIPDGTPKIAWIAMGLQEADEDNNGCGWYNGYNWAVYKDSGYDEEATTRACVENIRDSLKRFAQDPKEAVYFFYKKFVSQWNAPTFQAMITNEWYSRYTENKPPLADFLIYGSGRKILYQLMNFYHLFMFIAGTAGCWSLIKNWKLERAYFALNIFGGFLFHMIWEAQSRYILGYYVMMLPLAAVGCMHIFGRMAKCQVKINERKRKSK